MTEPDILGAPYTAEQIVLADDDEGAVVATLVHRPADGVSRPVGAVFHVHGFADYFFQTEYAEWWTARGYDFYAVDLRKYGRSLGEHQTPNYVADLREHFAEIDEAWTRITGRDGHARVILSAHSTGGLIVPLWANDRSPAEAVGMVLNSPWFDLRGSLLLRTLGTKVIDRLGALQPKRVLPRDVSGFYARSLHRDHEGEWDFSLDWKPLSSWPVHAGWLRAVRRGHAELQAGLDLTIPTLVLCSTATGAPVEMDEVVHNTDIVLDVAHIRRWSPAVSRHVTIVGIEGARHDTVLSRPPVRARVYAEIERWHSAYLSTQAHQQREELA
ncbi:alpha/beta hydrolase [Nocardioides sp.]|uniref:alpha/beta hydrolase n=1 Tax=Nocardioides sp. TaxID=35761 RepID=UPI003D10E6C4